MATSNAAFRKSVCFGSFSFANSLSPESILHNCCPELVGKEDELPLTDNQESNALLQRIATCSTAELQFFVDQLPALRQFKPKR
ncbi:MAG: hypothetical protein ACLU2C_07210 [Lachnospiraceae bacterium]|jgi:hypothetical protein|nr:hypothetical protein [Clostridiales bacterium]